MTVHKCLLSFHYKLRILRVKNSNQYIQLKLPEIIREISLFARKVEYVFPVRAGMMHGDEFC